MKVNSSQDHSTWYNSAYPYLTGYGLWLRGGEMNTLPLEEFSKRPFKVLITRLSTYSDTASSFTHSLLYEIAADLEGCFPDLAYLPPAKDVGLLAAGEVPWLIGTQTKFGPGAFDVIAFSNSIVQELLNLPPFLINSGIPAGKEERMKREDIPLILLGGSNALHSTSIWGPDPLVDGIFIGEDPFYIKELLKICRDAKAAGLAKRDMLAAMAAVPGFVLPENPGRTTKRGLSTSVEPRFSEKGVMPYTFEEIGGAHLQVSEGCPAFCGFCSESWIRKPYREFDPQCLIKKAVRLKAEMGLEKINIFSFNFNVYSRFHDLVRGLVPMFSAIGLKSQRFDMLASEPSLLDWQFALGKASLSCGLEGISPRLRRYLNKGLDENLLMISLALVFETKVRELKVFLLVTGREAEDDFFELDRLLDLMRRQKERARSSTRVIFSATPLVRFPWTPLEFEKASTVDECRSASYRMEKCVENAGFEFREAMSAREYMLSQILVRASDDRMTDVIKGTFSRTGFVYYRGVFPEYFSAFMKELGDRGIVEDEALGGFSLEESRRKKWACIETGVSRDALWSVYEKNRFYEDTKTIGGSAPAGKRDHRTDDFLNLVKKARKDEENRTFVFSAGARSRGVPRKYAGLALARALMKADAGIAPYFRKYIASFWCKDRESLAWIEGVDLITLSWAASALARLDADMKTDDFILAVNRELEGWGEISGYAPSGGGEFTLDMVSALKVDLSDYLKNKGLKYTLYKEGPEVFRHVFTRESVKKGVVRSLDLRSPAGDGRTIVKLVPGPKFDLDDFMKDVFASRDKNEWVKVDVKALLTGAEGTKTHEYTPVKR